MGRNVSHKKIVEFHQEIQRRNKALKGFYRFNWVEIEGQFRSGIGTPALLLESHSTDLSSNSNKVVTFNNRRISFLIIDFTGVTDDYEKQEDVLDATEDIALDIVSFLKTESKKEGSFLHNLFDVDTVRIEKVGPIFDNMYGWNVLYTLKNKEPMCFDPEKWID